MKINTEEFIFSDGFEIDYCGAKPFGGDREHERAGVHRWEVSDDDLTIFCCRCGVSALRRPWTKTIQ